MLQFVEPLGALIRWKPSEEIGLCEQHLTRLAAPGSSSTTDTKLVRFDALAKSGLILGVGLILSYYAAETFGLHATWLSPRARQIIDAARDLLEQDGWEGLSMRALGEKVGIRAPSLYKHFNSKDALRVALITIALLETGARLHAVIDSGGGIRELLAAYRDQAHRNPHLYRLAATGKLPRSQLAPGLEEWSGTPFFLLTGGDPARAQALWSLAHGMTILELDQRYPGEQAMDETWHVASTVFEVRS